MNFAKRGGFLYVTNKIWMTSHWNFQDATEIILHVADIEFDITVIWGKDGSFQCGLLLEGFTKQRKILDKKTKRTKKHT